MTTTDAKSLTAIHQNVLKAIIAGPPTTSTVAALLTAQNATAKHLQCLSDQGLVQLVGANWLPTQRGQDYTRTLAGLG